ncbi:RTA1 like protein-domain-containing protein [Dactylonectria estremocensis]|uniref:RTA1 like protein-domain-containing protein n=1 Tax=Dactylonectria estremocensis TaxID=1079267 RepID=A0A9P9FBZ7_9HYPO|nr:RTA1 like protein-domain-containing protein [Dactylonectria estremocensis]
MATLPNGNIPFGPNANCTLDICPLETSLLRYQPNVPSTIVFISVFGLSLVLHTYQGARTKTWGFMISMISGCILEIIGYVGRLIIHDNPFDFIGFLLQIICITVAPIFFCSAIYVILSQVINFINPSISRFDHRLFYWVFISCDIVSLILQALGGAYSCVGTDQVEVELGENISLAGLVFQVVTLVVFAALFIDYVVIATRSPSQNRPTKAMNTFIGFLFASTVIILIRCVYRIVELGQGYFSETFRDEGLFIGLESVTMCVATTFLNVGHPGMAFSVKRILEPKQPESLPSKHLANGTKEDVPMDSIEMGSIDANSSK